MTSPATSPASPNPTGLPSTVPRFAPGEVRTVAGVEYVSVQLRQSSVYDAAALMAQHGHKRHVCASCFRFDDDCTLDRACGFGYDTTYIVTVPVAGALLLAGLLEDSN
jgi:hypothetical protein